jgi:two-component system, LuxR family, response regulator FixJ
MSAKTTMAAAPAPEAPPGAALEARGTVYLVDDEAAVRRSLSLLLRLHGYATRQFGSAEEFLAAATEGRPACALVDVFLPGVSGLELHAQLARRGRTLPVLLMTARGDAALARTALLQGASDFLEKPIDETELCAAIEAAVRADAQGVASDRERERQLALLGALSARERALFDGITSGKQAREIAARLGVTPAEYESGRGRLMEKLQVRRLTELFRLRFRLDGADRAATPPFS